MPFGTARPGRSALVRESDRERRLRALSARVALTTGRLPVTVALATSSSPAPMATAAAGNDAAVKGGGRALIITAAVSVVLAGVAKPMMKSRMPTTAPPSRSRQAGYSLSRADPFTVNLPTRKRPLRAAHRHHAGSERCEARDRSRATCRRPFAKLASASRPAPSAEGKESWPSPPGVRLMGIEPRRGRGRRRLRRRRKRRRSARSRRPRCRSCSIAAT